MAGWKLRKDKTQAETPDDSAQPESAPARTEFAAAPAVADANGSEPSFQEPVDLLPLPSPHTESPAENESAGTDHGTEHWAASVEDEPVLLDEETRPVFDLSADDLPPTQHPAVEIAGKSGEPAEEEDEDQFGPGGALHFEEEEETPLAFAADTAETSLPESVAAPIVVEPIIAEPIVAEPIAVEPVDAEPEPIIAAPEPEATAEVEPTIIPEPEPEIIAAAPIFAEPEPIAAPEPEPVIAEAEPILAAAPEPEVIATPPPPSETPQFLSMPTEPEPAAATPEAFPAALRTDRNESSAPVTPPLGFSVPVVSPFVLEVPLSNAPTPPAAHRLIVRMGRLSAPFDLTKEVTTIGRPDSELHFYPDVEIDLDDAVSRRHAEVLRRDDQFYVVDAGSTNGTMLNGEKLPPHEERLLAHGDRIRVGERTEIIFE